MKKIEEMMARYYITNLFLVGLILVSMGISVSSEKAWILPGLAGCILVGLGYYSEWKLNKILGGKRK